MAFRVGQKVVCVNVEGNPYLTLDAIYTVGGHYGLSPKGYECIFLDGAAHNDHPQPFYAYRFRPVVERKTDISIFTKMLTDKRVDA